MHKRDSDIRTKAKCGVGYSWPSTISLTDDDDKVTCRNCKKKIEEEK